MDKRFNRPWIWVSVFLILTACTDSETEKKPPQTVPVTVQLKWVHQAQFAGFYVAQEKGYYAEEGLAVTFIEGGLGVDLVQPILTGQADFTVLSPEDILIRRSQGDPITALAAIYRRSATVYVTQADSGIVRPFDMIGKTAAVLGSGTVRDFEFQFRAMMKRLDIDISKIRLVPYDPEYTAFYNGEADITAAYLTAGVIQMRQKGLQPNLIWPGDYRILFYSDTLAATESFIASHPERVTRFLRATLKGWTAAVGDPKEATRITLKHTRTPDETYQENMMEALLPLVHTGEDAIGWMKAEDWRRMCRILVEQEIISAPLESAEKAFTLRFLEEVYPERAEP